MSALGYRELDESANAALTNFHNRTGWEGGRRVPVTHSMMAVYEAIESEDDGEDGEPTFDADGKPIRVPLKITDYDVRQRMAGARGFIRFLLARGPHPTDMLMQLADGCRTLHIEPFNIMTMEEQAGLFGQGKAAVSFRGKLLSREIRLSGMRADKIPGQKSKAASESYREREIAKKRSGNGTNGSHPPSRGYGVTGRPRARQKSFLRQLHVAARKKGRHTKTAKDTEKSGHNNGSKAA